MPRSTLQKIRPLHPEKVPPMGAVPAGATPDGKQLFTLERQRSRAVPDIDPDTGKQRMRHHGVTNEPLYALNKPEIYTERLLFFLESQGNGQIQMVPYVPITAEEMAAEQRQQRVEAMKAQLAEALVEADMTPAELVAAARAVGQQEPPLEEVLAPAAIPEPVEGPAVSYPLDLGGGWYQLSTGDKVQAKKDEVDALEAEAAGLKQRAREQQEQTPEV